MDPKSAAGWYDLRGRTVAITGGAGVLGGHIAVALVACGANVAVLDLDLSGVDRHQQRLAPGGGRFAAIQCDVLDRHSLTVAEQTVREELGAADTLINAAGGNSALATTGPDQSFLDLPPDAMRSVFDLNVLGTMLPCQLFAPAMMDHRRGVILNVASMSGLRPLTRIPAYSAAKAAVTNFTQWLAVHMAQEYSPEIRVNAIAPGFFMTEQNRFLLTDETDGRLTPRGAAIIEHTPMGRFGQPDDLLGTVLWLLSDASSFVTGVVVPVDGGFSAFSGV